MVNVTKTYLPDFEEYIAILRRAWDKGWITNNGELVVELEQKLKTYLDVENLLFTCNGTVPLQMALKALNITKEVITTPFSYVATTNAILWEGCKPVFVDIDPATFCIDASKIEAAITADTQAILATHVYGIPCDVEAIATLAKKHKLKVIYDGAHAFGCTYKGKSLLSYGDISTCSFHATKIFHTVEGGCIIANDNDIARQLMLYRQFGHVYDDYHSIGINGKNSEFHAAMGLAILPHLPELLQQRRKRFEYYQKKLANIQLIYPIIDDDLVTFNYSYCVVLLKSELHTLIIKNNLEAKSIHPRRYFYPALNTLQFLKEKQEMPNAEDISSRILSIPLSCDLAFEVIDVICDVIENAII